MNVGNIVATNQKGQIVIPKDIREALHITQGRLLHVTARGSGIYIYPIIDVISELETEGSYLEVLKKTKGAWQDDDWDKTRKKRRRIELQASQKRRKAW